MKDQQAASAQRTGRCVIVWCAVFGLAVACSRKEDPKDAIRALLDRCETEANKGSVDGVLAVVAADYKDLEGRDRNGVERLVRRHIERHSKRFVHVRPLSLKVDDNDATAAALVALAGQQLGPDDDLLKVGADLLKLHLTLRKNAGAWQVTAAAWKRPSPLDVL